MKKGLLRIFGSVLLTLILLQPIAAQEATPTSDRMQWWKDAKFGMFIHWGLYAIPAGKWGNVETYGEWIMNHAGIPVDTYAALAPQFNPTQFDAESWVKLAKEAGQKYIVITSKHHDGFALFHSKASSFNVVDATPFKRDILQELAAACRKYDMKYGFYYSQAQDWHHPGGAVMNRKKWDPAQEGDMMTYVDQVALPQVKEILEAFPDLAILWWDTPVSMTDEMIRKLAAPLKDKPLIITNDRLGASAPGDLATPEQYIPATGFPGRNWEVCMTMNGHWGYSAYDEKWKSTNDLLHKIIDVVSKGGNMLLNVGPKANGVIPEVCQQNLKEIGQWFAVNGESIYGTTASPFPYLANGRATRKGQTIYIHIFDWPKDHVLDLPLDNAITRAYLLADKETSLPVKRHGTSHHITLPHFAPDANASVLAVEFKGEPVVLPIATQTGKVTASSVAEGSQTAYLNDNDPHSTWYAAKGSHEATVSVDFEKPLSVQCLSFIEPWGVWGGQGQTYDLQALVNGDWISVAQGKTNGTVVTHPFAPVTARAFRLQLINKGTEPALCEWILYR